MGAADEGSWVPRVRAVRFLARIVLLYYSVVAGIRRDPVPKGIVRKIL